MADSNSGGKLYIGVVNAGVDDTPQAENSDLTQTAYEALSWLEVQDVGSIGETGTNVNTLTYDSWGTKVIQKSAGMANAGDPEVEVARLSADAGQGALRVAAQQANRVNNYAFKIEHLNGTIKYNRGKVLGPKHPNGRNEDFMLEVYTLALNQEQVIVS